MDNMQESKDYISKLYHHLFWDIDISNADMDKTIEPSTLELLKKLPQLVVIKGNIIYLPFSSKYNLSVTPDSSNDVPPSVRTLFPDDRN